MRKNVAVVDELGHEYEATYPKRAKGLVKSGRARFVDANRICLLRPPQIDLEDESMEQNSTALTAREIFDQIVKLQGDLKNIRETTELIQTIRDTNQSNGNDSVELDTQVVVAKIDALVDVFESREGTYQQMLSVYEKMYDDLTGKSAEQEKQQKKGRTAKSSLIFILQGGRHPAGRWGGKPDPTGRAPVCRICR